MSTEQELKAWIDHATYAQLLSKWRRAPAGSPYFQGELGTYYQNKMSEKGNKLPDDERVRTRNEIGW